jgi:hypothetical protein
MNCRVGERLRNTKKDKEKNSSTQKEGEKGARGLGGEKNPHLSWMEAFIGNNF